MGDGGPTNTHQVAGSGSAAVLLPANQMRARALIYASASGGYVGGPNVTTSNGMVVPTTSQNALPWTGKDAIYCVGSVTFYVVETSYD